MTLKLRKLSEIAAAPNPPASGDFLVGVTAGNVDQKFLVSDLTRVALNSNTTFYISTTGSDITGDGSVGNPWATPQHAYDYIVSSVDTRGFDIIVQCADGTYSVAGRVLLISGSVWTGGGSLTFQGNLADRTKVRWYVNDGSGPCVEFENCVLPGQLTLTKIQLTINGPSWAIVSCRYIGYVLVDTCDFGGGSVLFDASNTFGGQNLQFQGDLTLLTSGFSSRPGFIDAQGGSVNLIIINNLSIEGGGSWVMDGGGPFIQCTNWAFVEVAILGSVGSIVGIKFLVGNGGVIEAFQGDISFLPGTVAGEIDSGGVYYASVAIWTAAGPLVTGAGSTNYQVPTTGFSITLRQQDWYVILDPATGLNSGTVTMPAAPVDGQLIHIQSTKDITFFTLAPNSGQTLSNMPFSMSAGGSIDATWRAANSEWYVVIAGPFLAGSDLTFYVATTGSNSNPGTAALPVATIQHALLLAAKYDYQFLYKTTISVADGNYGTLQFSMPSFMGMNAAGGFINITGNSANPGNVICGKMIQDRNAASNTTTIGGFQLTATPFTSNIDITGGRILCGNLNFDGDPTQPCIPFQAIGLCSVVMNNICNILPSEIFMFMDVESTAEVDVTQAFVNFPATMSLLFVFANGVQHAVINWQSNTYSNFGGVSGNAILFAAFCFILSDTGTPADFPGTGGVNDASTLWFVTGTQYGLAMRSNAGLLGTGDIPAGTWVMFKDTSGGGVYAAANDGGTIKKVALV